MSADEFDDLTGFLRWYMAQPRLPMIPFHRGIKATEGTYSVVLLRQDPYQVEMIVAAPGAEIPDHVHPNVDSYEVYLGGEIMFRHGGQQVVSAEEAQATLDTGLSARVGSEIRVRQNDLHGATIGAAGGVFLSVQKWLNGIELGPVASDWNGPYMGPKHAALASG